MTPQYRPTRSDRFEQAMLGGVMVIGAFLMILLIFATPSLIRGSQIPTEAILGTQTVLALGALFFLGLACWIAQLGRNRA